MQTLKLIPRYLAAEGLWLLDLVLAFWLFMISRTAFLGICALFYKPGAWLYSRQVDLADKIFLIAFGLGWLVFMIIVEAYLRAGVQTQDIFRRFARITGPVLAGVFVVDLLLIWLQGGRSADWLRWFVLVAEFGLGGFLITRGRPQPKPTSVEEIP